MNTDDYFHITTQHAPRSLYRVIRKLYTKDQDFLHLLYQDVETKDIWCGVLAKENLRVVAVTQPNYTSRRNTEQPQITTPFTPDGLLVHPLPGVGFAVSASEHNHRYSEWTEQNLKLRLENATLKEEISRLSAVETITDKKLNPGRFKVQGNYDFASPDHARRMLFYLAGVVVLRAEYDLASGFIEYTGYSVEFEDVPFGTEIPYYNIVVKDGKRHFVQRHAAT